MSLQSYVHGYIEELGRADDPPGRARHAADSHAFHIHNCSKLMRLPLLDTWPPLTRDFFALTSPQSTFRNGLIYFAGSFKQIEDEWSEWLMKFEGLLKRLVWLRASLRLETELSGTHDYSWTLSPEVIAAFYREPMEFISEWHFSGGPRSFKEPRTSKHHMGGA